MPIVASAFAALAASVITMKNLSLLLTKNNH